MGHGAEPAPEPVNRWLVSLSVLAGTFMVVLDSTVVNVSLPHIAGSLSASVEESTWALTSYLAANAIILPITGWLATYVGRKRLLLAAVTSFTSASILCGLSPSLTVLIVFRVVQGASGGVMQPLSQAVMLESFPPRERGKAMALWAVGIVVAPIFGPVIGGWLTDNYTWRWIFYINLPVGLTALAMIRRFVFDPPYIRRRSSIIDYWGIGMLAVGIGALQVALDKGQESDWFSSRLIVALVAVSVVSLAAMVARELIVRHPVVDLRVFRERTYAVGVLLVTLMGFVLYGGGLVLLPILVQTLMGYPALQAGIMMAPRGLGTLVITPIVGLLMTTRVDPRKLLALGFATAAVTLYWFSRLDLTAGFWNFFWPQIVQGMSFGLLFVPLTTITMDPIPNEAMGNATSLFNLMRNLGGSVGIAAVQTYIARHRQVHFNVLGAHVTTFAPGVRETKDRLAHAFMAAGADVVTATGRAYAVVGGLVAQQAGILAFIDAFRLLAVIFLVIAPLALLMRRPRTGRAAPTPSAGGAPPRQPDPGR
jgi:DHA2 family multidrug resistance protein